MVIVAANLDFTSELFSPRKALSSKHVTLPFPNSKTYNNLSEYYAYTFGKKGSRENKVSNSKKNESDQMPERNYAWYYAYGGLEYSEDEKIEEYFSRDIRSKSSVALPIKRKATKSFPEPSKSEKCDAFAPLRSNKVIVSKATNSGQCKKYFCYSVKNVRKRLSLRQTIDTFFEKQTKGTASGTTGNLPDCKTKDTEIVSGYSDINEKGEKLNDIYDSDSSDDSLSQVAEKILSYNTSGAPTMNNRRFCNQKQLHIKSDALPKDDTVIPVKATGIDSNVMNQSSSNKLFLKNPSLFNPQNNFSLTDSKVCSNQQLGQLSINKIISAEDPAKVLKSKENSFDCQVKSAVGKKLHAMNKHSIDNICPGFSVSNPQQSLPSVNNGKVLQKESPKQLKKVLSASSVKPKGFSKSENSSDCILKPTTKENISDVFSSCTLLPTASSVAMEVKSRSKVKSNGRIVQSDQRPAKKAFNVHYPKPNEDVSMLKAKVKNQVNRNNNSVARKENIQTPSNDAGTGFLLKYGAIIPNNNKLRGFKIPLKPKVLSEISN